VTKLNCDHRSKAAKPGEENWNVQENLKLSHRARPESGVEGIATLSNVGAIFRSAAAFGVDAVLVTPRCADPLYRRSIRVSMGTVFQVPWTRIESWPGGIAELQAAGFHVAALALDDESVILRQFSATAPERTAVVFGTEGDGLKRSTIAACDSTVMIPMSGGVDSLNVAAASAVTCFALQDE